QDLDAGAARLLGLGDELGPIGGVAHGRGCKRAHVLDLENAGDGAEADERFQRALDGVIPEPARRRYGASEPAQDLLVEERRRRPHRRFIDDEADRVGTDIDDADRLEVRWGPQLFDQTLQARQSWPLLSLC